ASRDQRVGRPGARAPRAAAGRGRRPRRRRAGTPRTTQAGDPAGNVPGAADTAPAVLAAGRAATLAGRAKAREFKVDDLQTARQSANDLWRWAKSYGEHG